jgi:hypothetical protein
MAAQMGLRTTPIPTTRLLLVQRRLDRTPKALRLKVLVNPNYLWIIKEREPHMDKAG